MLKKILPLILISVGMLFPAFIRWTGSFDGRNFYEAGNWLGGVIPQEADVAWFFNSSVDCDILPPAYADTLGGIRVDGSYGANLRFRPNTHITFPDNASYGLWMFTSTTNTVTAQYGSKLTFLGAARNYFYAVTHQLNDVDFKATSTAKTIQMFLSSKTLTIAGDLTIDGGNFDFRTPASTSTYLVVQGDMSIPSSGTYAFTNTNVMTLKLEGDITGNAVDFTSTSSPDTDIMYVSFEGSGESNIPDGTKFQYLTFAKSSDTNHIKTDGIVEFTESLTYGDNSYFEGGLRYKETSTTGFDIDNYAAVTLASSGDVQVTKYSGLTPPGGGRGMASYMVIDAANLTQNVTSVKLYYDFDKEKYDASDSESYMNVWRSTDSGTSWYDVDGVTDTGNDHWTYSSSSPVVLTADSTGYFAATANQEENLPVEFDEEHFYANAGQGLISLDWRTHSEISLRGFNVYRSVGSDENFVLYDSWETNPLLETKNEGGFSIVDTDYNYIDENVENGIEYFYRIEAYTAPDDREFHPKTVSAIVDYSGEVNLLQNYPNPFNSKTTISFVLPKDMKVSLKLFNTNGQFVKEIVNRQMTAGKHFVSLNNASLSSGIYYYVMEAGQFKATRKMMHLK